MYEIVPFSELNLNGHVSSKLLIQAYLTSVGGNGAGTLGTKLKCKCFEAKLLSGLKCCICGNFYRSSCAELVNNIIIIDENTVQCCGSDSESSNTHESAVYSLKPFSDITESEINLLKLTK